MNRSLSKGWVVVGATAVYFAGCGGTSVKRGVSDDDTKGQGGTTGGTGARGGTAGVQAGRGGSGAQGGSTVGAGAGPAQGARGGGPGTDGGSSGTAGTAGTGGSAGEPGTDPSCDCTVGNRTFSCSSPEVSVPSAFLDAAKCELLDARVKRQLCDDGSTHYTFVVGEENDYFLEANSEGKATYFSGSGYVAPGCGLDPSDFDYGSWTMGHPSDSACFESCALCGEYDDLPACQACETHPNADPHQPSFVRQPLDEWCALNTCPATANAARELLTGECSEMSPGVLHTGCGIVTVERSYGTSHVAYVFNEQSGALQGVRMDNDVRFGPCEAWSYVAGDVPVDPCVGGTTCTFCASATGEGGAGGVDGAAGAAGDSNGLTCVP